MENTISIEQMQNMTTTDLIKLGHAQKLIHEVVENQKLTIKYLEEKEITASDLLEGLE